MRVIVALVVWVCIALVDRSAIAQSQIPCRYEVAHVIQGPTLPPPTGAPSTIGVAISPNGRYVCGRFAYGIEEDRPFIFDTITEQFIAPGLPPGFYAGSFADINDNAIAVGTGEKTDIGQRGFVFNLQSGKWTELEPLPGGLWSGATGINSSNVVCGWRSIGPGVNPQTAFRWSAEKGFEDLGLINGLSTAGEDINDFDVVTGRRGTGSSTYRGIVWEGNAATEIDTLNGLATIGFALNNSNEVVGRSDVATAQPHAFHWMGGTIADLGTLPGHPMSFGNDINAQGTIAGISRLSSGGDVAVTWTTSGIRDLNELLQPKSDLWLRSANSIANDESVIVGASSANSSFAVLLKPIFPALGDITNDCQVGIDDLLVLIEEWGNADSIADLNHDQMVNVQDLLLVINNWTLE